MRRRVSTETDDTVKVVRGLSATHKTVIAVATIIAVLYSAITFIVNVSIDRAFDRYDRERQKIGRPEFKNHKEKTEQEIERMKDKLEKLDDRVDRIEAKQ